MVEIDISTELAIIRLESSGEEVRMAIADAMEKIVPNTLADISTELETIRYGRYGSDIRNAIHSALNKLANNPIPPSEGGEVGYAVIRLNGVASHVTGIVEEVT